MSCTDLIWAGGLVRAIVVAEVLVSFGRFRLSVHAGVRLIDRRDIVTQSDGLHGLVDATADTLADFRARRLGLRQWSGTNGVSTGRLGGHLT